MLPFSEHDVFTDTEKGKWIRSGTDGKGNCFFHAYVYSLDASNLKTLNEEERLAYIMHVKLIFSKRILLSDTTNLIDVNTFDNLVQIINKYLPHGLNPPDLSKQPLLSIGDYVKLICSTHQELHTNDLFQSQVSSILQNYHRTIVEYVKRDGSWMFDSLIDLFMKKMDINIWLISDDTKSRITHYIEHKTKYTIFMYHISGHFESIGFYKDNTIQRVFENPSFP